MSTNTIPEGYMQNSRGDLVREENVKEIDKIQDQVVRDYAEEAKRLSMALLKFKRGALNDMADVIAVGAEKYGVSIGGKKGNVSMTTYDGRYKIQRVYSEKISFGVELEAAKELFTKYLDDVTSSTDGDLRKLIDGAFRTTRGGQLRTADLLGLLRYDITHPDWVKACEALKDSITVSGNTVYVRVYERVNDSEQYRPIPLDIAALGGGYERPTDSQ